MAQNPLQQYFRQPKIFISLPSHGAYNKPNFFDGDVNHMPVFGMTGMDEIIVKTPDALLTGESTVKVISSCCPTITNPWELSNIDIETVLTAIRIATYGNELEVSHTCDHCGTENEYNFDLSSFIDYYSTVKFDNKVISGDLTISLRPLSYKQSSEFGIRNFQLQQTLKQVTEIEDETERTRQLSALYSQLAQLQNDIFIEGIESVHVGTALVTERGYIKEWVENSDSKVTEAIKIKIKENQDNFRSPDQKAVCDHCGNVSYLSISLDQADFFVAA